jgi:hypothetical protein
MVSRALGCRVFPNAAVIIPRSTAWVESVMENRSPSIPDAQIVGTSQVDSRVSAPNLCHAKREIITTYLLSWAAYLLTGLPTVFIQIS